MPTYSVPGKHSIFFTPRQQYGSKRVMSLHAWDARGVFFMQVPPRPPPMNKKPPTPTKH